MSTIPSERSLGPGLTVAPDSPRPKFNVGPPGVGGHLTGPGTFSALAAFLLFTGSTSKQPTTGSELSGMMIVNCDMAAD